MKFATTEHEELIRCAVTPMIAAQMGRDRKRPLRADWNSIKDDVMRQAVLAKFTQHESLCRMLLDTGVASIVEHTANDSYWGDGGDGSGRNRLGEILMEVREQLRHQYNSSRQGFKSIGVLCSPSGLPRRER